MQQSVMTQNSEHRKFRVKTYARRESRITSAQKKALTDLLDLYELPFSEAAVNFPDIFPDAKRIAVEIGFGDGEALVEQARQHENTGYLGIEVFRPGVGKCLLNLHKNTIDNVRVSTHDARDVLTYQIPANSINEFIILFPDPWPKVRHHKRRLINIEFIQLCVDRLIEGGMIRIVTDCEDYASQVNRVLTENAQLANIETCVQSLATRFIGPQTRYARKAIQSGNPAYEMNYVRTAQPTTQLT